MQRSGLGIVRKESKTCQLKKEYSLIIKNMFTEIDNARWLSVKSKLLKEYPVLTNSDLTLRNAEHDDFIQTIAYKLGKTRKELNEIISNL